MLRLTRSRCCRGGNGVSRPRSGDSIRESDLLRDVEIVDCLDKPDAADLKQVVTFSPRPENFWITESTRRRFPAISFSLASRSPFFARARSAVSHPLSKLEACGVDSAYLDLTLHNNTPSDDEGSMPVRPSLIHNGKTKTRHDFIRHAGLKREKKPCLRTREGGTGFCPCRGFLLPVLRG